MKTKKILFIEDDPIYGKTITAGLKNSGLDVLFMDSLNGFRETLTTFQPHMLLLDLEVGTQSSADEIPFIRSVYPSLPIIIASSHTSGKEIGNCLNIGADYYVKKPYELEEILPLLNKLYPHGDEMSQECICFGKYQLNVSCHKLYYMDNFICKLNSKEFDLLHLLLTHKGQIVARSEILQQIWKNEDARESLNNYITFLRKHLQEDPAIRIINVKGVGYQLLT